jgi:replication factor C small subunit
VDTIWTEKYRPSRLRDMVGQKHATERLEALAKSGSIPHMLFSGPAGVGKTTAAVCVAKELFGKDWQANFLETNASDERGIDVVRVKIKNFARTLAVGGGFKIIFLDECDALTRDAQNALRRTMEKNSATCRFILSCNYINKIIDPIQSRCAVLRFLPLKEDEVEKYLERIVSGEGLKIEKEALEAIVKVSEGDLRAATNILQTAAAMGGKITEKEIYSTARSIAPEEVRTVLKLAVIDGNFPTARETLAKLMAKDGLGGEEVVRAFHREIYDLKIPAKKQLELVRALSECSFRIIEGASERIQLDAFLAEACLLAGERET